MEGFIFFLFFSLHTNHLIQISELCIHIHIIQTDIFILFRLPIYKLVVRFTFLNTTMLFFEYYSHVWVFLTRFKTFSTTRIIAWNQYHSPRMFWLKDLYFFYWLRNSYLMTGSNKSGEKHIGMYYSASTKFKMIHGFHMLVLSSIRSMTDDHRRISIPMHRIISMYLTWHSTTFFSSSA